MNINQLTRRDPVTGKVEPIPPSERVRAIIEHPRADELVRSMDAQAFYGLVTEAGLDQTYDLILMASGEQVQAIVDFDCWTRDQFDIHRLNTWLEILLQADGRQFGEIMGAMDVEPLVVWLREQCQLFLWETDRELIDTIDAPVSTSPDGVYAIIIPEEDQLGPMMRHLLHRLYVWDMDQARRILEAVRWELTSDMVEHAYQLRTSRLGDLGFVPFHEALEVYAVLDPTDWATRVRARAADPDAPVIRIPGGSLPPLDTQLQTLEESRFSEHPSLFIRALARLPQVVGPEDAPTVADAVISQFRAVANRVHISDLGNPGDAEAARRASRITEANLSLGLELSCHDDLALAARALAVVPLKQLHRIGYSTTTKLAQQARGLVERGNLTLTDARASLLSAADTELLDGLLRTRPRLTDDPAALFRTMDDVERAARRLGRIAFYELSFFNKLRHARDEVVALAYDRTKNATPVETISFRSLFATLLLAAALEGPAHLQPLSLTQLNRAIKQARQDDWAALHAASDRLLNRLRIPGELSAMGAEMMTEITGWLEQELESATLPVPPELAEQLVLLSPT